MRKLLIAAVVVLAPLITGCEEEPVPEIIRPVHAMKVVGVEAFEENRYPGKARATRRTNVSFEVSGHMIQHPVDVGDTVNKGDLLAALDQRDFVNALEQAQAAAQREALLVDRLQRAYQSGAVALQQVNDAEARLRASQAEVKIREKALEDSRLVAPHDGTIAATYAENFEQIVAKQPILRLLDTSRIEMIVNVPENAISYVPYVVEINVRFDSYPHKSIPAEFLEISNEATEATRTYKVTLIMDQPDDFQIQPGMSGEVTGRAILPEQRGKTVFEVPITAVFSPEDSQETFVWVIDEQAKTVSRRDVKVGVLTDFGIEITDGLEDGEWIATAGVHRLRDGQEVNILDFTPAGAAFAPGAGRPLVPYETGQQVKLPSGPGQPAGGVSTPVTGGKEE